MKQANSISIILSRSIAIVTADEPINTDGSRRDPMNII